MKTKLLSLLAVVLLITQPAFAGSSIDGGEKNQKKEVASPGLQSQLGEMGPEAGMDNQSDASMEVLAPTVVSNNAASTPAIADEATTDVVKIQKQKIKPLKVLREMRNHGGSSPIFGILALVFGIAGILLVWFFLLGGAILALAAIVMAIFGMSKDRRGKPMAIVGMVLGILTLVIPILLFALILAYVF